MRILLIAALVSTVAVAGCRGGEKNSTSANNSASANASGSASGGTGGATADTFRQLAISQCEQTIRSSPNPPPGLDAGGICNCAIQTAFGNQADPLTFARSPEGRQVLTQAIISCGQQRMGGAGAKAPGANAAGAAEEEGEEQ